MLLLVSGNEKKKVQRRNTWTLVRSRFNSSSECNNTTKGVKIPRIIPPPFSFDKIQMFFFIIYQKYDF